MTVGFYNYYNIQGRYSPDTPQDHYQQMVDRYNDNSNSLHHYNENPYSEENLALRKLDEYLAPIAQEIRSKCKSKDEVHQYLCEKYFKTSDVAFTKRWKDPETYAMFENELNAVLFGTIGCANRLDPRLEFDEAKWDDYTKQEHLESNNILKNQMQNLLKNNGIELSDNDSLIFSFNPYTYQAEVKGGGNIDSEILKRINDIINSNNNSKELFYWTFQNSENLDHYSVAKMRAKKEVLELTGLDLERIDDSDNYSNLLDIVKNSLIEKNDPNKNEAYNYIKTLLDTVLEKGYHNIEDLNLSVYYSNEDGFSVSGKIFNA